MRMFRRLRLVSAALLRLFSTKRNIPRGAEFLFVFFQLVLPESSHTKKNSAPRGMFLLVENNLNTSRYVTLS